MLVKMIKLRKRTRSSLMTDMLQWPRMEVKMIRKAWMMLRSNSATMKRT